MANSISVAVADSETIVFGSFAMVTGPVAVSMVTGNPAATVVVGVAVVVVVAGEAVVLVAGLPQAARTAQTANARKGVLLKKHPPYRRMKESVGSETARFRLHPRRFVCAEEAGGLARLAVCRKPRFPTRQALQLRDSARAHTGTSLHSSAP
jgi:hypothetical protein